MTSTFVTSPFETCIHIIAEFYELNNTLRDPTKWFIFILKGFYAFFAKMFLIRTCQFLFKFAVTNIRIRHWNWSGKNIFLRSFIFKFMYCSFFNYSWTHKFLLGRISVEYVKFMLHGNDLKCCWKLSKILCWHVLFMELMKHIWSTRLHERLANLVGGGGE